MTVPDNHDRETVETSEPFPWPIAHVRWRCRRGMLELDLLLAGFVETRYAQASPQLQSAFCRFIEKSDPELYDLLLGQNRTLAPAEAAQDPTDGQIIQAIFDSQAALTDRG